MPLLKVNGRYWALPATSTLLKKATRLGATLAPWIGAASIAGGFVMMDQWYYAKKGAKEEPEEEQEE